MKPLSFGMWFVTCDQMKPSSPKALWSNFGNKKPPSPWLQGASALCSATRPEYEFLLLIFMLSPEASLNTFDLCFLIPPEAEGKWVIEVRVFFLCCFWWLGFLFSHCARICSCILCCFAFFSTTVGSLCPWTLNFCSYKWMSEHLAQFKSALDKCRYAWNIRHGCEDIRISY